MSTPAAGSLSVTPFSPRALFGRTARSGRLLTGGLFSRAAGRLFMGKFRIERHHDGKLGRIEMLFAIGPQSGYHLAGACRLFKQFIGHGDVHGGSADVKYLNFVGRHDKERPENTVATAK